MIPSANTVARESCPPVKRSYSPSNPPLFCWLRKKSVRARTSTPGAVMCAPIRYTNRHRSVKRILSFSSGVFITLLTACAAWFWAMMAPGGAALLLDRATSGDDRLTRLGADLEATHRDRRRDFAVRQHLHRTLAPHETRGAQAVGRHLAPDLRELVEADDARLLAEGVGEPALRQPARERHLTALEARLAAARAVMTRARLDTLVALTRRLTRAGAGTAPETLAVPIAARHGREVMEADLFRRHCLTPRRAPPRRGGAPA